LLTGQWNVSGWISVCAVSSSIDLSFEFQETGDESSIGKVFCGCMCAGGFDDDLGGCG
jgi:hypothetical protein